MGTAGPSPGELAAAIATGGEKEHTQMSNRGLDKLALVSKILLDERVIELRNENEKLRQEFEYFKLIHAGRIYTGSYLISKMELANVENQDCRCNRCPHLNKEEFQGSPELECEFFPWFKTMLTKCGLKMQFDGSLFADDWTPADDVQIVYNPSTKRVKYVGSLRCTNQDRAELYKARKKLIQLFEYVDKPRPYEFGIQKEFLCSLNT